MASSDEKSVKAMGPPTPEFGSEHHTPENADGLHRRLNNRQIQLIAIGGAVGTGIFVSIGQGLAAGGPGSLLISFILLSCVLALVNNSLAEMTVLMPVSGGFVRLAGHWVDDALGFTAGWNFFFYEALLIPFEVTALNIVLSFWNPSLTNPGPTAGICAGVIILYALLNVVAVRGFGEAEFWLSSGKVILIFMLLAFTFVTMVGGNPQGDAYGFRHWTSPGAFAEHRSTGALGKFEGFLGALWSTAFSVVGPEYISMVAAEAQRPRIYIKAAFKTLYWRLCIFFVGSALAVGIVVGYNDPTLVGIINGDAGGSGTAAASPYVIAMENMGIDVLPHIVNALMCTSIFSAGNTYTYCAMRGLYGLALDGRAPAFLRKTNAQGVPIYAFCVVMIFPMLSFLQVSSSSQIVLNWLLALITAGGLITYLIINTTFLFYYRACKAQGLDRTALPYYGWFQPWCSIIAMSVQLIVVIFYGYTSFAPWDVESFFKNYTMQLVAPCLFVFWKLFKKTSFVKPHEADLVWERPTIDAYEASFTEPPAGFWTEVGQLVGIKRRNKNKSDVVEA
ncbi:amino acid transporter [Paramyrothecium foliicola]|nr:amino acid transporter [Paramyrothecium foliicola]